MAKIAMIGAGSLVFCKTLMADFWRRRRWQVVNTG